MIGSNRSISEFLTLVYFSSDKKIFKIGFILNNKYDVIIIGSGPGGEGAAMTCAKEGEESCCL